MLFVAEGCHLCERAREIVEQACPGGFETVDIGGVPELEAAYRQSIPVVEIDGERAFTYFVHADELRRRLAVCA